DRQSRQGTSTVFIVELCRTLEKARVRVENVTWVRFTARRTTKQKRHLAISHSLFGQNGIADQRMLAIVTEIFTNCTTGTRSDTLHWCRIRSGSSDHNRIFKRNALFEHFHKLSNSRTLLANSDIDAVKLVF